MNREKILRLLDEADDIVSALYRQGANKDYKCKSLREKLKAIAAEITAPPKSNADRIRQMTDEELAEMVSMKVCRIVKPDGKDCPKGFYFGKCDKCVVSWLRKEVSEDAGTD